MARPPLSYRLSLALLNLRLKPGTAWDDPPLPPAEARVRRGDLAAGRALLADTRTEPELRTLRVDRLSRAAVRRVTELARLAGEHPDDPDLALWLGATRIAQAWRIRGGATAEHVGRGQFEEFWLVLGGVYDPLKRAADTCPHDPTPWEYLQWRGLGLQLERETLDEAWEELRARSPFLYPGCYTRVQVLCPKWQGSTNELLEFVSDIANNAPSGHPVAALPCAAHLELAAYQRVHPWTYFGNPPVRDQVIHLADEWMENQLPHLRTADAHHLFGAACYLAGDTQRARRHLHEVDRNRIPRGLPWSYLNRNRDTHYRFLRRRLG